MGKSVSFRLGYLLGLSIEDLQNISLIEFEKSQNLRRFSNYVDAQTLRFLCRCRNEILLNFSVDSDILDIEEHLKCKLSTELESLSSVNIDIIELLKNCRFIKFVNIINKSINIISYKVLVDLDIPFIDDVEGYFSYTKWNKADFLEVKRLNKIFNPFKIVIPNMYKLETVFKYLFKTDDYILINAFTLGNKRVQKLGTYTYEYRQEMGVDLDETAVIDLARLSLEYTEKFEKVHIVAEKKKETIKEQVLTNLQTIVTPKIEKKIVNPLTIENSSIFIDCNNVEFFKVLCFLNNLETKNKVNTVTLFIDEKSNMFWRHFDKFYSGNLNIKIIELTESDYSLNIRITKEICVDIYKNNKSYILLCSNNSKFYGLFDSIDTVKFIFCYSYIRDNTEYAEYLRKNKVLAYNISELETQDYLTAYTVLLVIFSFISFVSKVALSNLDKTRVKNWVLNEIQRETSLKVKEKEISKYVSKCYDSMTFDIQEDGIQIQLEGVEIKI